MALVKDRGGSIRTSPLSTQGAGLWNLLDVYNTQVELRARIQSIYQYVVDEGYYAQLMKNYHAIFAQIDPDNCWSRQSNAGLCRCPQFYWAHGDHHPRA